MARMLLLLTLLSTSLSAQVPEPSCSPDSASALALFPQELDRVFASAKDANYFEREACVMPAKLGSMDAEIVAFSNTASVMVGVIKEGRLISIDLDSPARGSYPALALDDLDGDGVPEVILQTLGAKSISLWVYRWTGETFTQIGPVVEDTGLLFTRLTGSAEIVDMTGDGLNDFLQRRVTDEVVSFEIFSMVDGEVKQVGASPWVAWYQREKGTPVRARDVFPAEPGTYIMRVINAADGFPAVTSGDIILNGKAIVNPGDFKSRERVLERSVTLTSSNTLEVEVRGEPEATLLLLFIR